jgi:hypothetical protein
MEEAAEGLRTALKDAKGNPAKLKKFEKLARLGGAVFGWVDAPLELAFALPGMLQGNKDKALRDTTLGLFGAGKTELEKLDPNSKAFKVAKEVEDLQKWTKNYFDIQEAENYLENADFSDEVNVKQKASFLDNYNKLLDERDTIIDSFEPTTLTDKVKAREEIRDSLKKQAELGLTITDVPFAGDVNFNPYAKGEDISKTLDYLKYEGDPYYKLTKPFEEETGISMFGDFSDKDLADRYSDLPLGIAAGLAKAEKQQLLSGLKRERTAGQYAPRKLLEEQGFNLSEINKAKMFASGGIASLTTTIPPKRGPNHQGLASLKKYGKQY